MEAVNVLYGKVQVAGLHHVHHVHHFRHGLMKVMEAVNVLGDRRGSCLHHLHHVHHFHHYDKEACNVMGRVLDCSTYGRGLLTADVDFSSCIEGTNDVRTC